MKGISKHRTGTSVIAAVSALVLATGLMLPQTLAFATDDDATQAPAAAESTEATANEGAIDASEGATDSDYDFDQDFWFRMEATIS